MAQPNGDTIVIRSYVTTAQVDLDISDLVNYHVVEFDGLGMPPVEHVMQAAPQQDGAGYQGFRLKPRIVTISIAALSETPPKFHQKRIDLLRSFAPSEIYTTGNVAAPPLYPAAQAIRNPVIQIRWTYQRQTGNNAPVTETRVLYCQYHAGLTLPTSRMIKHNFRDVVQLIAPNPLWWDETPVTYTAPALGTGTLDTTFSIDRSADQHAWDTYPIITVTGPATGLVLTNNSLGWQIYNTGTIAAGAWHKLDLRYGVKTIVNNLGASALASWRGDLGTFRLSRGQNTIRFQCTGATAGTAFLADYYKSYIGI